jgi:transposase
MRKSKPLDPEKKERLYVLLKESQTKSEFQRIQCLWLREVLELSSKEIAIAIGWDPSSVRRLQSKYLKEGETALLVSARGGRHRENLSLEEEKEVLEPFFEKSKAGGILIVKEIKLAYEGEVGGKVPKSTIYRMLARHGWRKVSPRPHHPKADSVKQEEFKKKLRK